ncbi:hypothetical protein AB0G98_25110 [Streptomyces sp. NPDC020196]|uniref:NACHT domain-containing protein n=1 Tax=Streptomyces sp. NPDC020196 TaxID=3156656 RepID=UPI0033E67579
MASRQVAQQSGQSWRYLYERLGEKPFQQLCNALLAHVFPDVSCFPVGHADGGRDAVLQEGKSSIIFQVKWTSHAVKDPVTWLDRTIKDETSSIRRLVEQGAEKYYILTSVAGTGTPGRGGIDRLHTALEKHSKEFGISFVCWWRADIDARVDAAPDELKWAYSEMLAGSELIRYLIEAQSAETDMRRLRALLLKVIATQWRDDAKVKFKQVELDSHDLADLFVDVEATLVSLPRRTVGLFADRVVGAQLGGAAAYLTRTAQPFTLVRGEPGQGKSTLGQYLCQQHRTPFLRAEDGGQIGSTGFQRFPLRIDLSDYALWLLGTDPFSTVGGGRAVRVRPRASGPLEEFLKDLLHAKSGKLPVEVDGVHDLLHRLPVLIVLDGLDEVARRDVRARVVKEVNEFCARLSTAVTPPQVVVTTRPNASDFSEPDPDLFETVALSRLSPRLRISYLRKWAATRHVSPRDRLVLERSFQQRSAEPHIDQLAANPMQLTILLYLLQKRANSVPSSRTALYSSYMETFLDREATKWPAVQDHRQDLEEVTAYLGWDLQSRAEADGSSGHVPTRDLKQSILVYLYQVDKETSLVDDLFTAVTDRVWALSSKVQGTFEFDVQPVREYFAAHYLYHFAGVDQSDFDSAKVLRSLIQRPYWLNTCRFYCGFAKPNDLAGMLEALEEERDLGLRPRQVRLASWALLADGVFNGRVRSLRRATDLFTDDLSVRLLHHALGASDETPALSADRGGKFLAESLLARVAGDLRSPMTADRVGLAVQILGEREAFDAWWQPQVQAAAGGSNQALWMGIGRANAAGSRLPQETVAALTLENPLEAAAAVAAGVCPPPDSNTERWMLHAALDGHCCDQDSPASSHVHDILRVVSPQTLIHRAHPPQHGDAIDVGHLQAPTDTQRQTALQRLKRRSPQWSLIQAALRTGRGQKGTTSSWGNTARELSSLYGPCWLAAEIAVIGAASPRTVFLTGGNLTRNSEPLGESPDYGRLLQDVRANRSAPEWWSQQYVAAPDSLSRRTWALALLTCADADVVSDHLAHLDQALAVMTFPQQLALCRSSSRLGASAIARRLRPGILSDSATPLSALTQMLVAHHSVSLKRLDPLTHLDESALTRMAQYGVSAWPSLRALTSRMITQPSNTLLDGIKAHGPSGIIDVDIADASAGIAPFAFSIMEEPDRYPMAWLLAAERCVAGSTSPDPLPTIAEKERWFTL